MALAAAAALLLLLATAAEAPEPCCLRVAPYHIQALAQRVAQRFQALEFRAQDLRGVFASFQAVHGNVSHRLRFLEAEHAHLGEVVSRLEARLRALEDEKRMEEQRRRVEYFSHGRLPRAAAVASLVLQRRRRDGTEPLLVQLQQPTDPPVQLQEPTAPPLGAPTAPSTLHPAPPVSVLEEAVTATSSLPANAAPDEPEEDRPEEEETSSEEEQLPTTTQADAPLFVDAEATSAEPSSPLPPPPSPEPAGTTPTPLWALEETNPALLHAMSASDEDDAPAAGGAVGGDDDDGGGGGGGGGISYWAPAKEPTSLEELFRSEGDGGATEPPRCDEAARNCSGKPPGAPPSPSDGATVEGSTEGVAPGGDDPPEGTNSPEVTSPPVGEGAKSSSEDTNKSGGCSERVEEEPPPVEDPLNVTFPLLDAFPPGGGGGGGGGCSGEGCQAVAGAEAGAGVELSDAELQQALHELDALLQRPAAGAPPPDPEKLLLKRALKLALGALERTSDACLTLVNLTANAFEGLAAAET